MIDIGPSHTFHLHLGRFASTQGREPENPHLQALLDRPNVVRHDYVGRWRYQLGVPAGILRSRSRVYYKMEGGDGARMWLPSPCPAVSLMMDCGPHLLPQYYSFVTDHTQRVQAFRRHLRAFDLLITISETVKGELIDLFNFRPEQIVVAPCAIDLPAPDSVACKPDALPKDKPFFLMVNPGRGNKNWEDVLAAFSIYIDTHSDAKDTHLVLAGSLNDQGELIARALAANPSLSQRVLCLGYIPSEEMLYLYRNALLSVFPSRYEGFGIPVLEAFVHNLPLIVSDIPVFREVAGDAALRVPLDQPHIMADAFRRIATEANLRADLIAKGQKRLQSFSWTESAQLTLNALTGLGKP